MKMQNLKMFQSEYGVSRETVMDWIDQEKGFAGKVAYKINSRWYIDIPQFIKWRDRKHRESYRY